MGLLSLIFGVIGCIVGFYLLKYIGGLLLDALVWHSWKFFFIVAIGAVCQYLGFKLFGVNSFLGIYTFFYPLILFLIIIFLRKIGGEYSYSGGGHSRRYAESDYGSDSSYCSDSDNSYDDDDEYSYDSKPSRDDINDNRPSGYCIYMKNWECRNSECSHFRRECPSDKNGFGCSYYESDFDY